jgi:hypothetical protein
MKRHLAPLVLLVSVAVLAACADSGPAASGSSAAPNVVADWVAIVQPSIHNPTEPRPPGSSIVLHTITQLAVYDAVVAIEGGYEPYGEAIEAPEGADVRAAIATAAYRPARGRVAPSQVAHLDGKYAEYMAGLPGGQATSDGIEAGEDAAASVLALRADDGFDNAEAYQCSSTPPPPGSSSRTAAAAPNRWTPSSPG